MSRKTVCSWNENFQNSQITYLRILKFFIPGTHCFSWHMSLLVNYVLIKGSDNKRFSGIDHVKLSNLSNEELDLKILFSKFWKFDFQNQIFKISKIRFSNQVLRYLNLTILRGLCQRTFYYYVELSNLSNEELDLKILFSKFWKFDFENQIFKISKIRFSNQVLRYLNLTILRGLCQRTFYYYVELSNLSNE